MVKSLVDTSIIIDLVRGYPEAHQWLQTINAEVGVTRYVWLEVIAGAQNKQKQTAALKIASDFTLVEVTTEDVAWAVGSLLKTRLAFNIDPFDCLIAATAHLLHIPLYTRNLKHFTPLLGSLAQKPY